MVFWGISAADEQAVLQSVVNPCKQDPFQLSEVEIDEFTFHYSMYEPPHIQNDVITINRQYAADHQVGYGHDWGGVFRFGVGLRVPSHYCLPRTLFAWVFLPESLVDN